MVDRLSDMLNKIKTNERIGKEECVILSTKLTKSIMDIMKKESYITDYQEFTQAHIKMLKIKLSNKINDLGVIKPRFPVQKDDMLKYESRYIPSKEFGILIISTPQGIMTNREARSKGIGGRLMAYVY